MRPKGVSHFCLQENVRKEMISHAEKDLFFMGIERKELRIVALLIEVFKIRSKIWWLQEYAHTIDNFGV